MTRFLIGAAIVLATIITAHAATSGRGHRQTKAHKHPRAMVVPRAAPLRTKPIGGYDQNHGAYDPWYWDPSYGR